MQWQIYYFLTKIALLLACNFFFGGVFGSGIRVMVASLNVLGSVPSASIFWKSLRKTGINSSLYVW